MEALEPGKVAMQAMDIKTTEHAALVGFLGDGAWVGERNDSDDERLVFTAAELKDRERDEIEHQVQEYLAKGNTITQCTASDNREAKQPLQRSRDEVFKDFRKFSLKRS